MRRSRFLESRSMRRTAALLALLACGAISARCPAPPITSSGGAVCLAKDRLLRSARYYTTDRFRTEERKDHWLVWFDQDSSDPTATSVQVRVSKVTGEVDVLDQQ